MARSPTPSSEFGRRLKAAMALRGMTVAELGEAVPPEYRLSVRTLDRTIQGRRALNEWEYALFAELLEVPEWFLREGFAGGPEQPAPAGLDRDEQKRMHDELVGKLDDQASLLRQLTREGRSAPSRDG